MDGGDDELSLKETFALRRLQTIVNVMQWGRIDEADI